MNLDVSFTKITKPYILDLYNNSVIYDEALDTFRFAHLSVKEFLENRTEFSIIFCNVLTAESYLL